MAFQSSFSNPYSAYPNTGVVINVQQLPPAVGSPFTQSGRGFSSPQVTVNGQPVMVMGQQTGRASSGFSNMGYSQPQFNAPLANQQLLSQQTRGLQMQNQAQGRQIQELFQWAMKEFQEAQLARMAYMNMAGQLMNTFAMGQSAMQGQAFQMNGMMPLVHQAQQPLAGMSQLNPMVLNGGMPYGGGQFAYPNIGLAQSFAMVQSPFQQQVPGGFQQPGYMGMNNPMGSMAFNQLPPAFMPPMMQQQFGQPQLMGQQFELPPMPPPVFPPMPLMLPAGAMGALGAASVLQNSQQQKVVGDYGSVPPWQQPPMAMPSKQQGDSQAEVSPFPNALPADQLPELPVNPDNNNGSVQPTAEEASVVGQPSTIEQPQPQPQPQPAPQQQQPVTSPDTTAATQGQPGQAQQPQPQPEQSLQPQAVQLTQQQPAAAPANQPQTLEEFPLYKQLAEKPTGELLNLLRDILSIPNELGQVNQLSDPSMYSLQTIEFLLFILRNRPDAATPETYGLLKQLKDMGLVMATINDTNIEDWKKKDSEVILMEALWAAAKLDSFQPPTIPLDKLPGYSSMIKPILTGQEKVPPLILMAAVQAVSPDMFARYNEVPKNTLTDLQDRLTQMVNKSGKGKWWTLGITKYPELTEEEKAIYLQTRDLVSLVLNGASLNSLPGMAPSSPQEIQQVPNTQQLPPPNVNVMMPMAPPVGTMPSNPPTAGPALPQDFPQMSVDELNQLVASLPPDQQQAIMEMQQQLSSMSDEELQQLAAQMGQPQPMVMPPGAAPQNEAAMRQLTPQPKQVNLAA
jgi:hypothetical protein